MPGIQVKQYPCCLSTQAAVDLMLDLVKTNALEPISPISSADQNAISTWRRRGCESCANRSAIERTAAVPDALSSAPG